MEAASILAQQTAVMCLLMALGYFIFKRGLITAPGTRDFTNMLMWVASPAAILNSFFIPRTAEKLNGLGVAVLLTLAAMLLSIVLAHLLFRRHPIEDFGVSFSNVGFIGIPLVSAVLGPGAVFYIAPFSAVMGVLQWTWGVFTITRNKKVISVRKILTNPAMVALLISLAVFLPGFGDRLPAVVTSPVSMLAAVNAPLAMVLMGCYLAQADLKTVFADRWNWIAAAVRLLLVSSVTAVLFCLAPAQYTDARIAVYIGAIGPVGMNTATLASLFGKDSAKAVAIVCLSTVFAVLTMPLLMAFSSWLWAL